MGCEVPTDGVRLVSQGRLRYFTVSDGCNKTFHRQRKTYSVHLSEVSGQGYIELSKTYQEGKEAVKTTQSSPTRSPTGFMKY